MSTTKEQRAEERRLLWLDAETRMPRVVRITANEARTLDRDAKPNGRNNGHTCMSCGHLTLFHESTSAVRFCGVKDCKCEVWDMDHEEAQQRQRDARAAREEEVERLRRWVLVLIVAFFAAAIVAVRMVLA